MVNNLFPEMPIFVVDDDEDFLNGMEFTLLSNNINNFQCCQDSRNAMSLLEKKKFSLIILDMKMPDVDGKELLPQIFEKCPGIPVIVMTAFDLSEIDVEYKNAGVFDFLKKPFESNELLEKVQAAINLSLNFSEIKPGVTS